MPSEKKRRRLSPGCIITFAVSSLFLTLTVLFFSPLEVVLLNVRDFRFSFGNIWYVQLILAVLLSGFLTLVASFLPRRACLLFAALQSGVGLAFWIQVMFLNGSMIALTGDQMKLTPVQIILNALIWFVVIAGTVFAVFVFIKKKEKAVHVALRAVGCALIAVQCTAMVSLVATADTKEQENSYIFTTEGEFEFGSESNVIVIVLDTADGEVVGEMMERYPELYDSLSGWTWYPNAVSTYSRTYPALIYMLTGEQAHYDRDPDEYAEEAFERSDFLPAMKEQGVDVRVFSMEPQMIGKKGMQLFENGRDVGRESDNLDYLQLEKNLIRISLYKGMPYAAKNLFQYKLEIINLSSFNYRPYRLFMEPLFYQSLQYNEGIKVSDRYKNAFRFYHFWSMHPGAYWGSDLKETDELSDVQILRGSYLMVEEFISALKKAGIYDRSLIIITADHGRSGGDRDRLERDRASNPVLMVKYPFSDTSRPMAVSKAPVSHEDLFETVYSGFPFESKTKYGSGKSFSDYAEDEARVRLHYFTALDQRNEEVALVEYQIDGDATDFSNWSKTGRYWDVLYSTNPKSNLSYQDVMDSLKN